MRAKWKRVTRWVCHAVAGFGLLVPAMAYEIKSLSTRADMVSGGDVLVQVGLADRSGRPNSDTAQWQEYFQVLSNGVDVSSRFAASSDPGTLRGLVSGLRNGGNSLKLMDRQRGAQLATLTVTNHPVQGPIFSGPHESPFFCGTERSGLGKPLDADCSVASRVDYFYRTVNGKFVALTNPSDVPSDLSSTTVYNGRTVPFIVRVESGTINRAIYRIAILDDPRSRPAGAAWMPGAGWNGKLQYSFGGGCGSGKRQGSNNLNMLLDALPLGKGFAVATSTLNVYGTACNDVLSAETAMMVKEHFAEAYGVPRYTVGEGGSGGAMQQQLIAYNYPGLLDGIVPERSFPDGQTLTHTPTDVILLGNYFGKTKTAWSDKEKVAVSGFAVVNTLTTQWSRVGDRNSVWPSECGNDIPEAARYSAGTNPTGVRCTIYDSMPRFYTVNPANGFAYRALDNVGVQYGLEALNSGRISLDQFIDLNRQIGGYDRDGHFVQDRTVGDLAAIQGGYRTGRVNTGKGMYLPIIDSRVYMDVNGARGVPDSGDVHTRFHSLEMRKRLINANGDAGNQIIWVSTPDKGTNQSANASGLALDLMDRWLENLLSDNSPRTNRAKVLAAKPSDLKDGCWDPSGHRIDEPATFDPNGACNRIYPYHGNPRTAAGAPITEDVVKCRLRRVRAADYRVPVTKDQLATLASVFPAGVCDYSARSQGWAAWAGPWQNFGDGGTH